MDDKIDLRIQKTQNSLIQALQQLLAQKNFDEITVTELCNKAQTRKATFYKHFMDKDDLFTFMIQNLQEEYESEHEKQYEDGDLNAFYSGILSYTLDFLEEHESMVDKILDGKSRSRLMDLISQQVFSDLKFHLIKDHKKGLLTFCPEYLASIFTGALVDGACYWIKNKDKLTKEDAVNQCLKIISSVYATSNGD